MMRVRLKRGSDEKEEETESGSGEINEEIKDQAERESNEKSGKPTQTYEEEGPPARGSDRKKDYVERGSDSKEDFPGRGSG